MEAARDREQMSVAEHLERIIERHGGADAWRRCRRLTVRISADGFAFSSHGQGGALLGKRAEIRPAERRVTFDPYPVDGLQGVWTPTRVWLADGARVVKERSNPRSSFARPIKLIRWDELDMLYFCGYALWNYLSFPWLLREDGVTVSVTDNAPDIVAGCLTLRADFAADFPTHSRSQCFHIDRGTLLLKRHDYVADPVGRLATAANICQASEVVKGLRFYTKRLVLPRLGPRLVLPGPKLVKIDITDIEVEEG